MVMLRFQNLVTANAMGDVTAPAQPESFLQPRPLYFRTFEYRMTILKRTTIALGRSAAWCELLVSSADHRITPGKHPQLFHLMGYIHHTTQ
jgi:hypothetical protein